jgi:3-methyladenine DNA glycosylase AlkC
MILHFMRSYFRDNLNQIKKVKSIRILAWTDPWGFRRLRLPEFLEIRHLVRFIIKLDGRNALAYLEH